MDVTWKAHLKPVYSVDFSPCGEYVLSAGGDETVRLWSVENQVKIHEFPGSSVWAPVCWSTDGKYIARGGYGAEMWETESGTSVFQSNDFTESIAITPDSSTFVVHGNSSYPLRRWTLPGMEEIAGRWGGTRTKTQFPTGGMAIHPNGQIIATTFAINPGRDGFYSVAILWDQDGKEIAQLWPHKRPPEHATELTFSPDGKYLAGTYGPVLICWDVAGQKEMHYIQPGKTHFKGIAFSSDGKKILATNTDKQLRTYSIQTGKELKSIDPQIGKLGGLSISPNGKLLCTGSHLGKIRIWNP